MTCYSGGPQRGYFKFYVKHICTQTSRRPEFTLWENHAGYVMDKWHWYQLFSYYFGFASTVSFNQCWVFIHTHFCFSTIYEVHRIRAANGGFGPRWKKLLSHPPPPNQGRKLQRDVGLVWNCAFVQSTNNYIAQQHKIICSTVGHRVPVICTGFSPTPSSRPPGI